MLVGASGVGAACRGWDSQVVVPSCVGEEACPVETVQDSEETSESAFVVVVVDPAVVVVEGTVADPSDPGYCFGKVARTLAP